jgi:TPP-dependent indolepyruvate ferredoxin oxidoreductase alpha subunit
VFQPGVNEELAATALWGTQQLGFAPPGTNKFDGVFGIWYGKGPGVDRCSDVFKHANMAGTTPWGGVIAVAGDDHISKSSTAAHQSDHIFKACGTPVFFPRVGPGDPGSGYSRVCHEPFLRHLVGHEDDPGDRRVQRHGDDRP